MRELHRFRFHAAAGGHANDADRLEARISFDSKLELEKILEQLGVENESGWTTVHGIKAYVTIDDTAGMVTLDLARGYSVVDKDRRDAERLEEALASYAFKWVPLEPR